MSLEVNFADDKKVIFIAYLIREDMAVRATLTQTKRTSQKAGRCLSLAGAGLCNKYGLANLLWQILLCYVLYAQITINNSPGFRAFRQIPEYRGVSITELNSISCILK